MSVHMNAAPLRLQIAGEWGGMLEGSAEGLRGVPGNCSVKNERLPRDLDVFFTPLITRLCVWLCVCVCVCVFLCEVVGVHDILCVCVCVFECVCICVLACLCVCVCVWVCVCETCWDVCVCTHRCVRCLCVIFSQEDFLLSHQFMVEVIAWRTVCKYSLITSSQHFQTRVHVWPEGPA